MQGTDFCPGEDIPNVTTHDQVNNTAQPLLFHLGRDPGEKYIIQYVTMDEKFWDTLWFKCVFLISPLSSEYNQAIDPIRAAVADHLQTMKRADPQLNYCDPAVMVCLPLQSYAC